MRESALEQKVRKALLAKGAIAHKLTGQVGDPDRVVVWHDGKQPRVFYMELKTPIGRLSKAQKHRHPQLHARVYIVRSVEDALSALQTEISR